MTFSADQPRNRQRAGAAFVTGIGFLVLLLAELAPSTVPALYVIGGSFVTAGLIALLTSI
ncbi:hypothetical protein TH66_12280 [Carbonactinospora thermoautotrophica]|uniref:Uncharacterized protein n=1 Tax=Carbonactinospora thermoautotrophica TaxID=1469144 RepID=A0A132MX74_9ACTN|nr:hypothetical protein [Carbonactinospora thermoautotrophica]KWX02508.1 hypothetical protein LI90_3551 [Carbonactinospora thermoautotrophica]KWX03613.1 hypothetical protein TH66_12280 [Carbonactinospora thermoautotrophica]KWX08998.1 hypothetical protein TR74_12215 [Carbonactinospora thermoautotrophica]